MLMTCDWKNIYDYMRFLRKRAGIFVQKTRILLQPELLLESKLQNTIPNIGKHIRNNVQHKMHKNVMHKNDALGCSWKALFCVGISQNVITAKGPFTQTMCTVYLGGE